MSGAAVPRLPWFARVLVAFVRRELAALGGYRVGLRDPRCSGSGWRSARCSSSRASWGRRSTRTWPLYRGNYLGFVVIGLLGTEFQQVGVSVLAQRIRMAQMMGTLEAEVATPAAPWMVLGAPPVYEFVVAAAPLGRVPAGGQAAPRARPARTPTGLRCCSPCR